ncbi:MAG: imidazole glycerol phosphate synthase subunit HisH [Bacteroidota bacterium]
MKIAIIDYNAGNIRSVDFALKRFGVDAEITNVHENILSADKVIFPGVGEASSAMKYLRKHKLDELICSLRQPVLGICIGLQLMCSHSEEGDTECLGIFEEKVKKFLSNDHQMKIPQMGWNTIYDLKTAMFDPSLEGQYVYYVHSYYAETGKNTIAKTSYASEFSAGLHKDNFYATQFHPEKSGTVGAQILKNFLAL